MSNEAYGVEQMKKVLDVIIEGGNVAPKVHAATNVVGKITALVPLADELAALVTLRPTLLKKEWHDLSDEEKAELKTHVKAKFDLEDDVLEAKVEAGFELVNEAVDLVEKAVAYVQALKGGK